MEKLEREMVVQCSRKRFGDVLQKCLFRVVDLARDCVLYTMNSRISMSIDLKICDIDSTEP